MWNVYLKSQKYWSLPAMISVKMELDALDTLNFVFLLIFLSSLQKLSTSNSLVLSLWYVDGEISARYASSACVTEDPSDLKRSQFSLSK